MFALIRRYTRWLHTQWPAGTVEKLPLVNGDYSTRVRGLFVVGDLTGVPLLKFSADAGARVVQQIADDPAFQRERAEGDEGVIDVAIVGAGVSGMAAALEARTRGLSYQIVEASEPFSTIVNFPKGKPIYTYPTEMVPAGDMQFSAEVKEPLLDELREQTAPVNVREARAERVTRRGNVLEVELADGEPIRARRVIVGIGRSGNFRKLGVPGEDRDKVYNRLHDPTDFCGKNVLVVGGGDSALETAIALGQCGANVTLSYRRKEFSRPKPGNVDALRQLSADPDSDVSIEEPTSERISTATGRWVRDAMAESGVSTAPDRPPLKQMLGSSVVSIGEGDVTLRDADGNEQALPNDAVFAMIGREAPLDFFRKSGVPVIGDRTWRFWATLAAFGLFCVWLYHWKKGGTAIHDWFAGNGWFPHSVGAWFDGLAGTIWAWAADSSTWLGTLVSAAKDPGFYYALAYCLLVVIFGIRRIRRRKTPYVTTQTVVLAAFQVIPLFLLPYLVFPWMGHNSAFDSGAGKWFADEFFPYRTPSVDEWTGGMRSAMETLRAERTELQRGIDEGWGTEADLANKRRRITEIETQLARLDAVASLPATVQQLRDNGQVDRATQLEALYWPARRIPQATAKRDELASKAAEADANGKPDRAAVIREQRERIGDPAVAMVRLHEARQALAAGDRGAFEAKRAAAIDALAVAQPHSYWRSFGFILAWPLFVYNWFTAQPIAAWLVLGFLQTFVLIPLMLWKWGKGAYCGWICSCGALAETLGDAHRHKMPHGPFWNRLNMAGQVILGIALLLMVWRILGWVLPDGNWFATEFNTLLYGSGSVTQWTSYAYVVDLILAGIVGVALYFHFSGRVWCRFFCPLAALMHIFTRFSRFRIVVEKKKCISCNVCTSVCHQGIDIMNFANKGIHMKDPECVRCSACVHACPTGVLSFGEVDGKGNVVRVDRLGASPVLMREGKTGATRNATAPR